MYAVNTLFYFKHIDQNFVHLILFKTDYQNNNGWLTVIANHHVFEKKNTQSIDHLVLKHMYVNN